MHNCSSICCHNNVTWYYSTNKAKPHMIINTMVLSRLTYHHKWTRSCRVSIPYYYSKLKRHGISVVGDTNAMEVRTSHSLNVAPRRSITHTSIPPSLRIHYLGINSDSSLILSASCMSFGMMVTLLVWITHKFTSSNSPTLNALTDSWMANKEVAWNVLRWNVDRNQIWLNPAELPLQGAGMAPCG